MIPSFIKNWLAKRVINRLVKDLFHPVTASDILGTEIDPKTLKQAIRFKDRTLDAEEVARIKENALHFEQSLLWRFMKNQVRIEAQEIMFRQSKVDNDLYFGKAILFELKVMEDLLEKIKNINN